MSANKEPVPDRRRSVGPVTMSRCENDVLYSTSIPSVFSHATTTMEIHDPPCGRLPHTIWWRQTPSAGRVHYLWPVLSEVSPVHPTRRWNMQLLRDNNRAVPRRPHHPDSRRGNQPLQQSGCRLPFLQPVETCKRRARMARTAQSPREQAYETDRAGPFEKASEWGGDGHGELTPTGSSWNGPVWTPENGCDVPVRDSVMREWRRGSWVVGP